MTTTTVQLPGALPANHTPGPGVYPGVAFEKYAAMGALNHSTLRHMSRSPRAFAAAMAGRMGGDTPEFQFGHAFHALILEPEVFARALMAPPINKATGKPYVDPKCAAMVKCRAENPGRIIMGEDELVRLRRTAAAFMANESAGALMRAPGSSEETMVWKCPVTGMLCKGRIDRRVFGVVCADFKTTASASPDDFRQSIINYGYHTQDAFYRLGREALGLPENESVIIAVESDEPFDVVVYELDDELKRIGRHLVTTWLHKVAECQAENNWPGVHPANTGAYMIGAPLWYLAKFNDADTSR